MDPKKLKRQPQRITEIAGALDAPLKQIDSVARVVHAAATQARHEGQQREATELWIAAAALERISQIMVRAALSMAEPAEQIEQAAQRLLAAGDNLEVKP